MRITKNRAFRDTHSNLGFPDRSCAFSNPQSAIRNPQSEGFTLVELMLVMAILTIAVALVVPPMSHFFGGRTVDSEVQRFLALTRYGQSRAVSEGIPMMLWIDPKNGAYGLQQEAGYTDGDRNAVDYSLGKDVRIDVPSGSPPASTGSKQFAIHFTPDGAPDDATSVKTVSFRLGDEPPIRIAQSANRLTYEIRAQ